MTVPEKIAPGVHRVDAIGLSNAINVLLLEDEDGWTLVDTGLGSSANRIKQALSELGSGPEDLKRIFLTHQHDDHIGGSKNVLEWAPDAESGLRNTNRRLSPASAGSICRATRSCVG